MRKRNAIAAQFFYIWAPDDQNHDLTPDEVQEYRNRADWFLNACDEMFLELPKVNPEEKDIQFYLYEVGKRHFGTSKEQLNLWFKCLYTIFFGYSTGPRIGTFIYIFGIDAFLDKLHVKIANPLSI